MRKSIAATIAAASLILQTQSLAMAEVSVVNNDTWRGDNTVPIERIVLQNFVETHCTFRALDPRLILDERHMLEWIWGVGGKGCKGGICWGFNEGKHVFDWKLYFSDLPVRITNTERLSKSIIQTIKSSQSLRKSASDALNAAQEFLQASFGESKERGFLKERSMSETKSQEQSVEINTTVLFHRFLSMGLQGVFPARPELCFSSAVDLFFQALNTNRVNDLVEAFIFFQTMKPSDVRFTDEKSFLNRAKFLYLIIVPFVPSKDVPSKEQHDFAWASAILFAKLLEWEEFQDIKSLVDNYLDKVYKEYQKLVKHTTKELLDIDKELAVLKYNLDDNLRRRNKLNDIAEIEETYASMLIIFKFHEQRHKAKQLFWDEFQSKFNKALKNNDPLLYARFIKEDTALAKFVKEIPKREVEVAAIGVAGTGVAVAGALYFRKKKQKERENA